MKLGHTYISTFALCAASMAFLLSGCGGATDSDGPNSAADDLSKGSETDDSNTPVSSDSQGLPPVSEPLPTDPNAAAGGTSLNIEEMLKLPQCESGWLSGDPKTDEKCAATYNSICFETDEAACTCAGCAGDACAIAESYPTQISCSDNSLDCNFRVFDICYETAEEACEAAGCSVDTCIIAESYPAQPSCQ